MALALFGNNEKGFVYDCSTLTGAIGGEVSLLPDLSGNGNDLAQSIQAKQPKIADFGSKRGLSFDGIDDVLTRAGVDLSGSNAITLLLGIRYYGDALGVPLEHGFYMAGGGFGAYANNGAQVLGTGLGNSQQVYSFVNLQEATKGQPALLSATLKPGATIPQNLRLNGFDAAETVVASKGAPSASAFGNYELRIGSRVGDVYPCKFDLFAVVCVARELTAQEMADAEAWMLERLPPATNKARKHFDMFGTLRRSDLATHIDADAYAYAEFLTDASVVEVESYSTIVNAFPGYPSLADIGVFVDGQHWQTIRHTANGAKTTSVPLPSGSKRVRIMNGPQARPAGRGTAVCGTWLKGVTADAPLKTEPNGERMFIYGDSIATGAWAVDTQENAWHSLVREQTGVPTSARVIGSQTLYDDCATPAAIQDFVDRIARTAPTKIWLAIGTNDFGLGVWSAAAFGVAYGQLLDALRELMPWAAIYAQTPLLRVESGVQAYRDAIAAACSTRPWAVLVDGTAIMPLSRLPDGLHPDTEGHAMYAQAVISAIWP